MAGGKLAPGFRPDVNWMCCQEHADRRSFAGHACAVALPAASGAAQRPERHRRSAYLRHRQRGHHHGHRDQRPRAGQHPLPAGRHGGHRGVPGQQLGARVRARLGAGSAGDRTPQTLQWSAGDRPRDGIPGAQLQQPAARSPAAHPERTGRGCRGDAGPRQWLPIHRRRDLSQRHEHLQQHRPERPDLPVERSFPGGRPRARWARGPDRHLLAVRHRQPARGRLPGAAPRVRGPCPLHHDQPHERRGTAGDHA